MRLAALWILLASLQDDPARRARDLARSLDGRELRGTYRALEDLSSLGAPALAEIESLRRNATGRAAAYLDLAAEEIRSRQSAGVEIPTLARYTLTVADKNLMDVLNDLQRRSGYTVNLLALSQEEKVPNVTVDIRDATPLEAFDAVCKAANLVLVSEGGVPMVYVDAYQNFPRFFFGSYMFRLESLNLHRSVGFRKPAAETCEIEMSLAWDHRVNPVKIEPGVEILEALDDKGNDLVLKAEERRARAAEPDLVLTGQTFFTEEALGSPLETLEIRPPAIGAEKIAVLRGRARLSFPRAQTPLTFDKPVPGMRVTAPGFEAEVLSAEPADGSITVRLKAKDLKPEALAEKSILAAAQGIGNRKFRTYVRNEVKDGALELIISCFPENVATFGFRVEVEEPPAVPVLKLEINVVTETVERKVPFEFRDVKIQ